MLTVKIVRKMSMFPTKKVKENCLMSSTQEIRVRMKTIKKK